MVQISTLNTDSQNLDSNKTHEDIWKLVPSTYEAALRLYSHWADVAGLRIGNQFIGKKELLEKQMNTNKHFNCQLQASVHLSPEYKHTSRGPTKAEKSNAICSQREK